MDLPFANDTQTTFPPASERPAAARPASKTLFRPPALADTTVAPEPFARGTPRLRSQDAFPREPAGA